MKKTKIICTMGPNTNDRNVMMELAKNGMDVARFNFSHGDYEEHQGRLELLKEVRKELDIPVAALLDTKGPEIRTGQLKDGKKVTLKATVTPSNAYNKGVTWKSSNTKVATVSSSGVVTTKKKMGGKTVTITATAKDGSGKKASYKIYVKKGIVKKVYISGVKSVKAGKKLYLKGKTSASSGANRTLKWSSSNTKYAKVSSKGTVTTYKAGKKKSVKITARAVDGSGKSKTVTIKIK